MTNSETLSRAAVLAADLLQQARATDENGLSIEQVVSLAEAGLLQAADPVTIMENGRALAQGCGASAWLATAFATAAALVAQANPAIQAEVEGARITLAGLPDQHSVEDKDGQVVVSGVWPTVGGLAHAEWILLSGLTLDGEPACGLVATRDVTASAYPHRGGLRGLVWSSIELKAAPVHLISLGSNGRVAPDEAALLLGALVGVAQGAYADYVGATRARISGVGGQAVAQFTQVQSRLAETHAELKAVAALYADVLARTASGQADDAECIRDRAYIARKSVEAVNRLLSQMGAMGLAETNPVQRRFRDLRALASTRGLDWTAQMPAFGRHELGLGAA